MISTSYLVVLLPGMAARSGKRNAVVAICYLVSILVVLISF